jgi:uroporphyrin-3 C-methyltransferase/uroporphyrinogen III methyltransferase/synthase
MTMNDLPIPDPNAKPAPARESAASDSASSRGAEANPADPADPAAPAGPSSQATPVTPGATAPAAHAAGLPAPASTAPDVQGARADSSAAGTAGTPGGQASHADSAAAGDVRGAGPAGPVSASESEASAAGSEPAGRVGASTPPVPPAGRGSRFRTGDGGDALTRPLTIAVVVLAVLLAAHAWSTRNQIQRLRAETARNLQRGEVINTQTSTLSRALQDQTRELQAKVALLESRQIEAQSQQLALEQLYQDLSKNRDEWALAEIEQVLSTASQQLQLAGNVSGALIALQNADRALGTSDKPQFIIIRRAIAKDIEKLKALPTLDIAGLAVRLDNVIVQVDTLPMLAGDRLAAPAAPAAGAKPAVPKDQTFGARMQSAWREWTQEMWGEMRQLIRVRKVENPDALMLSPSEMYFVRENLKLRLLNARLALLARNEGTFRTDLEAVQEMLGKYFDTNSRETQAAQALLRQVQANNLSIEMPSLADSLNAVRNYKAKP